MTVPVAVSRRTVVDPHLERIQRDHELDEALKAARHLQARLEMLGDRAGEVAWIRALRDDLSDELVLDGPPCQSVSAKTTPIAD